MTTVSISDLEPEKADRFEQTFRRVLASQKAVETFAQIIDGLPTRDISMEAGGDFLRPEIWQRSAPCDISVREAQQLQAKISVGTMQVKAEVCLTNRSAIPFRSNPRSLLSLTKQRRSDPWNSCYGSWALLR